MDKTFKLTFEDIENKYVVEKTITFKFPEKKLEELREIAIEVDDTIEEVLICIVNNNLINEIDNKDFKKIVIGKYHSDMVD